MNDVKVILISQFPLPYAHTGSWTTMYFNYLKANHQIDYIICKEPESSIETVKYEFLSHSKILKIKQKFLRQPYLAYLDALKKIVKKNHKYIIQVVDNFGIIKPLQEFLLQNGLRQNCQIQFFYHGFPPFYENFRGRDFFESIDEMVVLTHDSYKAHKDYYTVLPARFSVLHNGIDTSKFKKVTLEQKQILKEELELKDEKVFIWCSKDLPKKGLEFILDVWKKIHLENKNTVLLVVGATRNNPIDGVRFLGKIQNQKLPKFYQMADCYLFPALWHEGFGLTLIEALHSGCYCIASALGGIPEVLQFGKFGKLVNNPHFQHEWEAAILEFLNQKEDTAIVIPNFLYTTQSWNSGMNAIIENAKKRMQ